MSIESECVEAMRRNSDVFLFLAQSYKISVLSSNTATKHMDEIMSFFLLKLLSEGDMKRFCLIRSSIERITEKGNFPLVSTLDKIWKASLLGDIPQMKQAVLSLPHIHKQTGEEALRKLTTHEEKGKTDEAKEIKGGLQNVIEAARMYFRV